MKYFFILLLFIFLLAGCTENTMAKQFGGTQVITLPKGYKLNEATWKGEGDLWYLIEPVDATYQPKVKLFLEKSNHGLMEGTIKFIEKN